MIAVSLAPDPAKYHATRTGILVPGPELVTPVAVDLFCGAGGFSCGVTQGGFHVAAACEWDYWAMQTYISNLGGPNTRIVPLGDAAHATIEREQTKRRRVKPQNITTHHGHELTAQNDGTYRMPEGGGAWLGYGTERQHYAPCEVFYLGDVRLLTGARVIADLHLKPDELQLLFGGPPCQGFSTAGRRNVMDPRNNLVFEFARLIVELNPATFVMENVVGIMSMSTPEGIPVLDAFCLAVSRGGYSTYDGLRKMMGLAPNGRVGTRIHAAPSATHPAPSAAAATPAPQQTSMFGT